MLRAGKVVVWAVVCSACLAAGCGARTDPLLETSASLQVETEGGVSGGPIDGCHRCTTQIPSCTYCVLQGSDSYVCKLGHPAPAGGCFNLQEAYNANGWKFTCYYCD